MKRDSFLNHLIDCELPYLESDLGSRRLSVSAKRFIARSLRQLGTSQINVQLDSSIADRLDRVARSFNLVRDSFINRLLYFSLGSEPLLKYFEVKKNHSIMHENGCPTGCFPAIHEIQSDPLAYLRRIIKAKHGIGLYLAPMPVELVAFECYLNDEIFWCKYNTISSPSNSTSDFLKSFESGIYHNKVHEQAH